jgi:hypothetical protein
MFIKVTPQRSMKITICDKYGLQQKLLVYTRRLCNLRGDCCKLLTRELNQLIYKQNAVSFHNEVLILNHSMLLKSMSVSKEYKSH